MQNNYQIEILDLKKTFSMIFLLLAASLLFCVEGASADSYNADTAVSYARQYALSYNSAYNSYKGKGGDCANFVSQCLFAGGLSTDATWKPYTTAWNGANALRIYLRDNKKYTCYAKGNISLSNISIGDLLWEVGSDGTGFGHVTIVTSVSASGVTICGHTNDRKDTTYSTSYINSNVVYHVKIGNTPPATPRGSEMTSGYDRVLPDGDYIIASAADPRYYLDIIGNDMPAAIETNVNLWYSDDGNIGDFDAWTIKYEDGFYRISQYGYARSLDVYWADTLQGQNVQVCDNNTSSAQKWAICRNERNFYRIQAKCSGYALDINGGTIAEGTNVQQWSVNDSNAQSWVFIPYKPAQPVQEGRYALRSGMDWNMALDVSGDYTEGEPHDDVPENLNVQIWNADEQPLPDRFDIIKLDNGYYKFRHAPTGKCLDVSDGVAVNGSNVAIHTDNGSLAQQWAIIPNGDGYEIISRCSGFALYVAGDYAVTGTNVAQRARLNDQWGHERWYIVDTEPPKITDGWIANVTPNNVTFVVVATDENGIEKVNYHVWCDTWTAEGQTVYDAIQTGNAWIYNVPIDLSNGRFWCMDARVYDRAGNQALTNAGYTVIAAELKYTNVYFDSDGGTCQTENKRVISARCKTEWFCKYATAYGSLPVPTKDGYTFEGWFTADGVLVTEDALVCTLDDHTLYAHWALLPPDFTLPRNIVKIESEAFSGCAFRYVYIPDGLQSISAYAFADCPNLRNIRIPGSVEYIDKAAFSGVSNLTVHGVKGSYAEYYAQKNGYSFIAE